MKVIMLRGLPASGKSTYALQQVRDYTNYIRVNKDELRAMLHGGEWSRELEKEVINMRDAIIHEALRFGKSVLVDDTNFAPYHETALREIAKSYEAKFEILDFEITLSEALKRDSQRANSVGEKVIKEMHRKYIQPKKVQSKYPIDPELPTAILCDIDGTLALMKDRSPFEWSRVGEDLPNQPVVSLVKKLIEDKTIIFMSGRDEVCRAETEAWLSAHGMPYAPLYMRPEGNQAKDSIIKRHLFDENIRGKFNIEFVLDDRDQVVEMWRDMGLTCLQVAEGNF